MSKVAGTCSVTVDYLDWGNNVLDWPDFLEWLGVDGDVWECPHEAVDHDDVNGPDRCAFHLSPAEVPDEIDESDRFRAAIEAAGVSDDQSRQRRKQFLGATFGAIELTEDPLDGEDYFPIVLVDAKFRDGLVISVPVRHSLDFRHAEFSNGADFRDATFDGDAAFGGATFDGEADFRRATFDGEADFEDVTFDGEAAFGGAMFDGEADFRDATFDRWVGYLGATFDRNAAFWRATFDRRVDFRSATFNRGATFGDTTFDGEADFRDVTFDGKVILRYSTFDGKVNFQDARFNGGADFREVTFQGKALSRVYRNTDFAIPSTFSSVNLEGIDFSESNLGGAAFEEADLTDVDFSKTFLRGANFETARLSRANLFKTDLRGVALAGAVLTDAQIDDETQFLHPPVNELPIRSHLPLFLARFRSNEPVLPTCGYDPEFTPPDDEDDEIDYPEEDLNEAKSVYRAIENLAGLSSRPRLEGRAFVRRQDIQREQYRRAAKDPENSRLERFINRGRWIRASFSRAIMLYGQSPWRVVGTASSVIGLFGLLYPLVGGMARSTAEAKPVTFLSPPTIPLPEPVAILLSNVYFSAVTFTTLGYGDIQPASGAAEALATVESFLGALLMALLVFVLGRRAAQ